MKIGIDLGGSHIGIGLVDNEKILEKIEYEIEKKMENSMQEWIEEKIEQGIQNILKKQNINKKQIRTIGIACPGVIRGNTAYNMVNLNVKEFSFSNIKKRYSDSIFSVANDAKCAAFAEKQYGALKKYQDSIFLGLGTGIGGAAFLNNKLLIPKRNPGFEFGHMIIKKGGLPCKCGNKGCFEAYNSIKRWKEKCKKRLNLEEQLEGEELKKILINRKEELKELIEEYIENLVLGISNIVNILEPEGICIGGGFVYYKEIFLDKLQFEFQKAENLFNKECPTKIELALLGNNAGIIGAGII